MKKFTVTENSNLKDFTDETYPQGSFAFGALLKRGDIRVNGVKTRANCAVKAGDEITYYTTAAQEAKPSHKAVYEDENIYIADKLSGVSSEALFCELKERGCLPVHRLDRNTSGLIALAKTETAQAALENAFRERAVEKVYLCVAADNFKEEKKSLTAYLKKDAKSGLVRIYPSANADRVKIVTEYEVLERRGGLALVKVILHTGKTHQIRAHLSFIGCPVLGDTKYGDFALNKKYNVTRQILTAYKLKFELSGELNYLNGKQFTSSFTPQFPEK